MMNILFVAWEFPPLTAGGVQRPLYFVKYLQDFGINPIVITVPEMNGYLGREDPSLLKEVPAWVTVERIACEFKEQQPRNRISQWASFYFSLVEKHGEAWETFVKKSMPGLIGKYNPVAIYVTIPPFSMAPLWTSLGKKHHLPVVLDFRDAWSQWITRPYGTRLHYNSLLRLEEKCMANAAAIVCTSEQIANDLKAVHPRLTGKNMSVITNGFDRPINKWVGLRPKSSREKIIIGYVGSFYYSPEAMRDMFRPWWKKKGHRTLQYIPRKENWLYRSPYFFFMALRELFTNYPEYKSRILIRFAGNKPDWLDAQISEFGLQENCECLGHLDHAEVISFQEACDALLITSSKVINGRDYSIAGKTFEYFTMGRPIIAFVCEGAQKDILEPSGICMICNPDDSRTSAGQLHAFLNGELRLEPATPYLEQFKRKQLTGKLAILIKQVAENSKAHA